MATLTGVRLPTWGFLLVFCNNSNALTCTFLNQRHGTDQASTPPRMPGDALPAIFGQPGTKCLISPKFVKIVRPLGRPFVKRFTLCCRTVVCLSVCPVLSVTFVHRGQTVGRIKMKLGTQVGLGHGHIVLDGDPAPRPLKGHSPPNFRPISVAAKWLHGSRCHLVWR